MANITVWCFDKDNVIVGKAEFTRGERARSRKVAELFRGVCGARCIQIEEDDVIRESIYTPDKQWSDWKERDE
jgi:hypothetical protein